MSATTHDIAGPRIERVRHELRRRLLDVTGTERLTPGMLRVTLSGSDLAGFHSPAFDDHVKLFVPTASGEPERRDYTPRRHNPATGTLAIDFAVHDAGPATRWALDCRPGDRIEIGGPKGSRIVSADVRRWLLIGDETALPAIGRRIEEAHPGDRIVSVAAVTGPQEHQRFSTAAAHTALWAHRPLSAANDPAALLAILDTVVLEPETFVWIAAEASVARAMRDRLLSAKAHPRSWIKAGGYWVMGRADAHERMD